MNGLRQKIQRALARDQRGRGEAPTSGNFGAEPVMAAAEPESPAATMQLMEEVCERENLCAHLPHFECNAGAQGQPDSESSAILPRAPANSVP